MKRPLKYYAQNGKSDCGPTAIANAMRWLGMPIPRHALKSLAHACNTCDNKGTKLKDLRRAVRRYMSPFCKVRTRFKPSLGEITEALRKGYGVIFGFAVVRSKMKCNGHFCFIDGMSPCGTFFHVANFANKSSVELHRNYLKGLLRITRSIEESPYPMIYILRPR